MATITPIARPSITPALSRPRPPQEITTMDGLMRSRFTPAPDLTDWIARAYLAEDGPLHNADHRHLQHAAIGCLWTNVEAKRHQRRIVGQAELVQQASSDWKRVRAIVQLEEWFGGVAPDFVLTFDAVYAADCPDAQFAALVDHELYHCGQALDEFGGPKFREADGEPVWAMRGHDVEEFVGVVRRFGIEAAGGAATNLVIAAAQAPEIATASLGQACGTCLLRRAA